MSWQHRGPTEKGSKKRGIPRIFQEDDVILASRKQLLQYSTHLDVEYEGIGPCRQMGCLPEGQEHDGDKDSNINQDWRRRRVEGGLCVELWMRVLRVWPYSRQRLEWRWLLCSDCSCPREHSLRYR